MRSPLTYVLALTSSIVLVSCSERPAVTAPPVNTDLLPFPILTIARLYQPSDFVEITAGDSHTCATQYGGNVYCWGNNTDGQIGTGVSDPLPGNGACLSLQLCVYSVNTPTLVFSGKHVDAGRRHTCAIDASGRASCWGYGGTGALGSGFTSSGVPRPVSGNLSYTWVSAGDDASCGVSAGNVYCWGPPFADGNTFLRLSLGVPLLFSGAGTALTVEVGTGYGCILASQSGQRTVTCSGRNTNGHTGQNPVQYPAHPLLPTSLGSAVGRLAIASSSTCVDQLAGYVDCLGSIASFYSAPPLYLPRTVVWQAGGSPARLHGVAVGQYHACALDDYGAAWCWGNGGYGNLGDGVTWSAADYPTRVAGDHTYRAIAVGARHTCAIGTDNVLYCWGEGISGQLGTGTLIGSINVPTPTAAPRMLQLN